MTNEEAKIRQLHIERAELVERLSQAYRLIGPAALYVRWYAEDGKGDRKAAEKLAKEMQAFFDEGLFGKNEEAGK